MGKRLPITHGLPMGFGGSESAAPWDAANLRAGLTRGGGAA